MEAEEKVRVIQNNLKAAQSRQKSYFDERKRPLAFNVGDLVYLKVSPTKGVQRFGVKGKLAPRYIGPYNIIEKCGPVAYRVQLPDKLSAIHNVFHVSQLKKCVKPPYQAIEQEDIYVEPDLSYVVRPVQVLDEKERQTRNQVVKMYKVQWDHCSEEKATWEMEDYLNQHFPGFLPNSEVHISIFLKHFESRVEILFKGGRL
jgi:hypothetical protein